MKTDNSTDMKDVVRVETHRSGVFKFQIGVDWSIINPLLDRVEDAHRRFNEVPVLPEIAKSLEEEVLVSSVFGTNTIEGGTLSEEEIRGVFAGELADGDDLEEQGRRVYNIRAAYQIADRAIQLLDDEHKVSKSGERREFTISIGDDLVKLIHQVVTEGLSDKKNKPGVYRDNLKGQYTRVGDVAHGGMYTPPKCLIDIELLMGKFVEWINSDEVVALHPAVRGHLAHYYFERIHPFFDGNGRVGRVLEALILKGGGLNYASFGLASGYLAHIDEYFSLFNSTRKKEERGELYPNTAFVYFGLSRLLEVFDRLHSRVSRMIGGVLYENRLNDLLREKKINVRQFTIVNNLLPGGLVHGLVGLRRASWYVGLYSQLTSKTRDRDLKGLSEHGLLSVVDGEVRLLVP